MMPDKRPSRVVLHLSDGTRLKAEAFINKGDFEDPYSENELLEKFNQLALPVWGPEAAKEIYSAIAASAVLNFKFEHQFSS